MKSITKLLFTSFFTTLLVACQSEALFPDTDTSVELIQLSPEVQAIKDDLDLSHFESDPSGIDVDKIVIDWENHISSQKEDGLWYQFPLTTVLPAQLKSDLIVQQDYMLVVAISEDVTEYSLVKLAHLEGSSPTATYLQLGGFHGMTYLYDLNGATRGVAYVENGETHTSITTEHWHHVPMSNCDVHGLADNVRMGTMNHNDLHDQGCDGGGSGWVRVATDHYTDWYNHRGGNTWEYSHTEYTGTTYEYIWVEGGGGQYLNAIYLPDAYSGGTGNDFDLGEFYDWYYNERDEGEPLRIQIDPSLQDTVAGCVLAKLMLGELALYRDTIGSFEDDPSFNLTFTFGECSDGDDACTSAADLSDGNITIKIQNQGLHALEYASLILHEGIHAEIFRAVETYTSELLNPNDWERLGQLYRNYLADNGNNTETTEAQHRFMTERYVIPLAEAIWKLDNKRYPLDDYMKFGWDGLERYGFTGYFHDGVFKRLTREESNEDYHNQDKVLNNTTF